MQAPIQSSRAQSFDEIYGPPENFLEVEVSRRPQSCHAYRCPLNVERLGMCNVGQKPADARYWEEDVYRLRGCV